MSDDATSEPIREKAPGFDFFDLLLCDQIRVCVAANTETTQKDQP